MQNAAIFATCALALVIGCSSQAPQGVSGSTSNTKIASMTNISGVALSKDGTKIAYESRGAGPLTLMLIHGWSCDRTYWDAQVGPLSSYFQIITLDLAGHGESGSARTDWTMAAFGEDVAAVAHALDANDVVLVGHSMGGPVMLEAALRMGDRVRALVGVDTLKDPAAVLTPQQADDLWSAFETNFSASVEEFVRSQFFLPTSDPVIVDRIASDMAAAPVATAISAGKGLSVHDWRDVLRQLQHLPLTLINAPLPPTLTENYKDAHDNMTLIVMDQTGHFPMQEVPELFNQLLKNTALKAP